MFLWTLNIVSLIFSTLSLQNRSSKDMEIATISQHIAKRINFPVLWSTTGPFFDPHRNRLPTTLALLQWFHFYIHPLKSFRWNSGRKQQKKCPKETFSELASTCLQRSLQGSNPSPLLLWEHSPTRAEKREEQWRLSMATLPGQQQTCGSCVQPCTGSQKQ